MTVLVDTHARQYHKISLFMFILYILYQQKNISIQLLIYKVTLTTEQNSFNNGVLIKLMLFIENIGIMAVLK